MKTPNNNDSHNDDNMIDLDQYTDCFNVLSRPTVCTNTRLYLIMLMGAAAIILINFGVVKHYTEKRQTM